VLVGESGLGIGAGVLQELGVAEIFNLFSRAVNGFADSGKFPEFIEFIEFIDRVHR
jgi:hypothetical protein